MNDSINWFKEGCQFLTAASGKKKKFNRSIRYNLLGMAFEKFVMAILIHHGTLPDNHTFSDLLIGLEKVCQVEPDMKKTILRLESAQQICSFTDCFQRELGDEDIDIMKGVMEKVKVIAELNCRVQLGEMIH
ncbi:MAG: hypothetical protein KKD44_21330 [Proteobacteria bacterium]|nr:hypothetical protein [Pseudomonadota bacterium]